MRVMKELEHSGESASSQVTAQGVGAATILGELLSAFCGASCGVWLLLTSQKMLGNSSLQTLGVSA